MSRPKLGNKKVLIEIPPLHHDLVKELARLRRTSMYQTFRDIIREGLDRVSAALPRSRP